MRTRDIAALSFLIVCGISGAAEPERAKGLSVHMLPDRIAQINHQVGGFGIKSGDGTGSTYSDAIQVVTFFQTLPSATQENGIWVVTTHPSAYSENERTELKKLVALCVEKKIPVFTCRGSELPGGWKRSDVPAGWDDSASTH